MVQGGAGIGWLVSGARAVPRWALEDIPLRAGVLAIALASVPEDPAVLLDALDDGRALTPVQGRFWPDADAASGLPAGLSVLAGRRAGVVVRVRVGHTMMRFSLPGPLPAGAGPMVLRHGWAAGTGAAPGRWWLALEGADGRPVVPGAAGTGAMALPAGLVRVVCGGQGTRHRHAAVGACAVRKAAAGQGPAPELLAQGAALSAQALVAVPGGLSPLGALRGGDVVLDDAGQPRPLAAVRLFRVPPGFPFSPLRLRAGRLPLGQDLLAGPQVRLAFAGDDVARLFGAARVLVPARHLPDPVQRRADPQGADFLMAVAVPAETAVLRIGGLAVACPGAAPGPGPLPQVLGAAETAALMADGGDMRLHAGAA